MLNLRASRGGATGVGRASASGANGRERVRPAVPRRLRELICDVNRGLAGVATLDLGCGSGLTAIEFRLFSAWLVGVDRSSERVERARKRDIYDALEVGELASWLRRRGEHFDVIVASGALAQYGDLRQILIPAAGLVDEGGLIAFAVERAELHPFHRAGFGCYAHHPAHVREVAADAGLTVARMEEGFLRLDHDMEITGLFVVLEKEPPTGLARLVEHRQA